MKAVMSAPKLVKVVLVSTILTLTSAVLLAQQGPTLTLAAPADRTVVRPGQTIEFRVSVTNTQLLETVAIIGDEALGGVLAIETASPVITATLTVPFGLVSGYYRVTAFGMLRSGGGQVASQPITLVALPPGPLSRLIGDRFQFLNYVGDQVFLSVSGEGSETLPVDWRFLTFSSDDPNIVTVTPQGLLIAQSPGNTAITIRYPQGGGELSAEVAVTVRGSTSGDIDGDGRVDDDDLNTLRSWFGHSATGANDARDLNHDGVIDERDLPLLEALCTETCTHTDTVAPSIVCASADGLWHAANISLACTAQDAGSGLANPGDASFALATNIVAGDEQPNAATDSRSVCDVTGNCASAGPIGGNMIDRKAPVITPPADQIAVQTVPGGAPVNYPLPAIAEAGSGLASSGCLPASGSLFPVGATTVTCTAADLVGNTGAVMFSVTVTPGPSPTPEPDGRIYGAGHVESGKTHHHFVFRVSQRASREYGRLEYWAIDPRLCPREDDRYELGRDGQGDPAYGRDHASKAGRFEATAITSVVFSDDPAFRPGPGVRAVRPGVDSVTFKGSGRWNGRLGYNFEATATDRGEPGRGRDTFALIVKDALGNTVASVSGALTGGNIQSTRLGR